VLAHGQRLSYHIEHRDESVNMDELRVLRSNSWEVFKEETTPAEFTAIDLLWEVYECQTEVLQGKTEKLKVLEESLPERIPFDGIDMNDMTWDIPHSSLLTAQVVP
jgi:hypothetical protein